MCEHLHLNVWHLCVVHSGYSVHHDLLMYYYMPENLAINQFYNEVVNLNEFVYIKQLFNSTPL